MSKFFRKQPTDSDSSSSASDSEELEDDSQYSHEDDDLATSRELEIATPPVEHGPKDAVAVAGPNKDLLLHALLEEKCLNDVRREHAGKPISESAIVIEARSRSDKASCHTCTAQGILIVFPQIPNPQRPTRSGRLDSCGSRRRCTPGCPSTVP